MEPGRDGHTDSSGHGTAVAALIAGHGHGAGGGDGILGIAPKAKILPYSSYSPDDPKGLRDIVRTVQGIQWVIEHGAQVVCIASSGGGDDGLKAAVQYALDKGVPVVAGAANRPESEPGFPAIHDGVISLSSVGETGDFAADVSVTGSGIRFAAPGVGMVILNSGGGYRTSNGNSYATAYAAGDRGGDVPGMSTADGSHAMVVSLSTRLGAAGARGWSAARTTPSTKFAVWPADPLVAHLSPVGRRLGSHCWAPVGRRRLGR